MEIGLGCLPGELCLFYVELNGSLNQNTKRRKVQNKKEREHEAVTRAEHTCAVERASYCRP